MINQRDLVAGCLGGVVLDERGWREQATVDPCLGRAFGLDFDLTEQLVDIAPGYRIRFAGLNLPDPALATLDCRPSPAAIGGALFGLRGLSPLAPTMRASTLSLSRRVGSSWTRSLEQRP